MIFGFIVGGFHSIKVSFLGGSKRQVSSINYTFFLDLLFRIILREQ